MDYFCICEDCEIVHKLNKVSMLEYMILDIKAVLLVIDILLKWFPVFANIRGKSTFHFRYW